MTVDVFWEFLDKTGLCVRVLTMPCIAWDPQTPPPGYRPVCRLHLFESGLKLYRIWP